MQISTANVIQYLRTNLGEGTLRFSEIYFSWPEPKRDILNAAASEVKVGHALASGLPVTREDVDFFRSVRQRSRFAGDLYELISEIELAVHDMVEKTLKETYGEAEYWRRGIPETIRIRCQENRERDEDPSDSPFHYTTLIQLSEIISKNWSVFDHVLPSEYAANKRQLQSDFARLNSIRNTVMHPVKRKRWSESDFDFAKVLHIAFQSFRAP